MLVSDSLVSDKQPEHTNPPAAAISGQETNKYVNMGGKVCPQQQVEKHFTSSNSLDCNQYLCYSLNMCVCVCMLSIGRAEQHKLFVVTAVGADITTARSAAWDMHSALSLSLTHSLTHSSSSYIQSAIVIHHHETESASTGS